MPRKNTSASDPSDTWSKLSAAEQSLSLDLSALCADRAGDDASPIDDFYSYRTRLIPVGTLAQLSENPALGPTLLLGLVSATELYFRRVLATLVSVCPLTRRVAARQTLALGAVDYYHREDLGYGLLENVSIAGSGEIRKQTARIAGVDIQKGTSIDTAITEFERLCELRHAATHSRGHLGHQNLRDLGLEVQKRRLSLAVGLPELHASASVCQNVVRAYNLFLYRSVVERWIAAALFTARWPKDRARFSRLFNLFHSALDKEGPATPYRAYLALKPVLHRAATKAAQRSAAQPAAAAGGGA